MATIAGSPNQDELDQDKQKQPGQAVFGSTISAGGPSASQQFNQQQQAPRQVASGRFTNIQQYLGANKQAGQQLGQTLQRGISQNLGQAQSTAGRQLGEAQAQATTARNLYNTGIQQYQQLGGQKAVGDIAAAPIQGAAVQQQYVPPTPTPAGQIPIQDNSFGQAPSNPNIMEKMTPTMTAPANAPKGTLASEYTADIGTRQQTAADIAANEEALKQFTGLRTGTTQQEQAGLIAKQNEEARQSAEAFKNLQAQRMQQLATESGRGGLLSEFIGGKNYGVGKRSLDAAFLQRDPNRAVDVLKQNIGAKAADVQQAFKNVGESEQEAQTLGTRGQALAQNLAEQTRQNVADYTQNIEDRIKVMEQQRGQKMDWARQQLEDFKAGKPLSKEFLDLMGIQKGTQLFNVPKDINNINDILNVNNLTKQLNLQDVANQQDVANYAAMAKLAGLSPGEYQLNKSTADLNDITKYNDERDITKRISKAKQDFLTNAAKQIITGNSNWESGYKNYASQNLLDFLTGGKNVANEMITRGNDYTGQNLAGLINQGQQLGNIIGIGETTLGASTLNPMGIASGLGTSTLINQAGQQLTEAAASPGGDIEKGLHTGVAASALPISLLPGDLGIAGQNISNIGQTIVSGLANTFGLGGGNDDYKGENYARNRSQFALRNQLADYLQRSGFYNYLGDQGMQTAQTTNQGTWDNSAHYDPVQDLIKFGYGTKNIENAGRFQTPNIKETPTFSTPVDRKQILQQLVANGQLSDTSNLENIPKII